MRNCRIVHYREVNVPKDTTTPNIFVVPLIMIITPFKRYGATVIANEPLDQNHPYVLPDVKTILGKTVPGKRHPASPERARRKFLPAVRQII